jgi:hypothetical protein
MIYPCMDGHARKIDTYVVNGYSEPHNCSSISLKEQGKMNTYYKENYCNAGSRKKFHCSGQYH